MTATARLQGLGYRLEIDGEYYGHYPDQLCTEAAAFKAGCRVRYLRDAEIKAVETRCRDCGRLLSNDGQKRCGACHRQFRKDAALKDGSPMAAIAQLMQAQPAWWSSLEIAIRLNITQKTARVYLQHLRARRLNGWKLELGARDPRDIGTRILRRYRMVRA